MEKDNIIKCPNCGKEIDVNHVLYHQLEEQFKGEFQEKSAKMQEEVKTIEERLKKEREQFQSEKAEMDTLIASEVKSKLKSETAKLEKTIREKLKEEVSDQIGEMEKELSEKTEQVKDLNKTKADFARLTREKEELQSKITHEKEAEFNEKLNEERIKIKKQADEDSSLKIEELNKKLETQVRLAEDMKRKAEQGSMQLQGEIQELVLEEILTTLFPFDLISEVAKGIKGADVIHIVKNKVGTECGTILYESKRTKAFSDEWISKLKKDAISTKAEICIIVTEALPDGVDKICYRDGVWVCSFKDFKGLVLVIRESLIKINEAYSSQTNKGEKMQMLYDYLTSTEFSLQVGAIIEGFTDLQDSYVKEKRAMERIWKQREKQLEKVLINTNHFIGSIKGIAGSSIPGLSQIGAADNLLEID